MLKPSSFSLKPNHLADTAPAASRQVWLAGLGAVAVTRDWAQQEAGSVFRSLVKEGSAVETRAMRAIGAELDSSMAKAATLWNQARSTVVTTVNGLTETAIAALPNFKLPAAEKSKSVAVPKRVVKQTKARRNVPKSSTGPRARPSAKRA